VSVAVSRAWSTSSSGMYCPYKGDASYWSIVLPEAGAEANGRLADAVWGYREPYPSVAAIAGHVAFYPDRVEVVTEDA
jgi:uncharacterized protein (DUF427 family)